MTPNSALLSDAPLLTRSVVAVLLALAPCLAHAQAADPYVRLLKATKFVEHYKEVAAVSARVFAARSQGSDAEYARFMGVVASADLSDITGCLANAYKTQDLTSDDIGYLTAFFESPLGSKLLEQAHRTILASVERLSPQPLSSDAFTAEERQRLQEFQRSAPYQKYSAMTTDRAFAGATLKCIASADAVKKSGIKF